MKRVELGAGALADPGFVRDTIRAVLLIDEEEVIVGRLPEADDDRSKICTRWTEVESFELDVAIARLRRIVER